MKTGLDVTFGFNIQTDRGDVKREVSVTGLAREPRPSDTDVSTQRYRHTDIHTEMINTNKETYS